MKQAARSLMVLASLVSVVGTATPQSAFADNSSPASLQAMQGKHENISRILQGNVERGSIVELKYGFAKADGSLVRKFLRFDLDPALKQGISVVRLIHNAKLEEILKLNTLLAVQAGRSTANPLLKAQVEGARLALANNRAAMIKIQADLDFLDSVENLQHVDSATAKLKPQALNQLRAISAVEHMVIEDASSIAKVLERAQMVDMNGQLSVQSVSVLKVKANLPPLPVVAARAAAASVANDNLAGVTKAPESRLAAFKRSVGSLLSKNQKPIKISAAIGATAIALGIGAYVLYADIEVQRTEENLNQ